VTTTTTPDLLDPAWWQDLSRVHDFFTWARLEAPVLRDEPNRLWVATRHADVLDVERRDEVWSSNGCYRALLSPGESNMIAQDDPQHLAQRRLVNRRFTPRAVLQLEPRIRAMVEELVDAATPAGTVEVVQGLAAQLPCRLTADLLGFPESTWPELKSWSERLMRTDAITRDPQAGMDMMNAIMEFNGVLTEVAGERKACPADDLVSVWVGAGYDDLSLVHETGLFIAGGAETTRTAISRGLRAFVDHPDQWEAMAADPSLVPGAVEEVLRWVTPLNNFFRMANADDRIGSQPVRAGDRVMLVYPSANRDEAVFDDPFRFDIRRSPNPHLAFGHGTHFCLGANLARLELRVLFEVLSRRWTSLSPVTEPDIEPNVFAGAVRRFDLAFTPR
jgi:cytochrome P450 family 142 subfamily A polypeptide 1